MSQQLVLRRLWQGPGRCPRGGCRRSPLRDGWHLQHHPHPSLQAESGGSQLRTANHQQTLLPLRQGNTPEQWTAPLPRETPLAVPAPFTHWESRGAHANCRAVRCRLPCGLRVGIGAAHSSLTSSCLRTWGSFGHREAPGSDGWLRAWGQRRDKSRPPGSVQACDVTSFHVPRPPPLASGHNLARARGAVKQVPTCPGRGDGDPPQDPRQVAQLCLGAHTTTHLEGLWPGRFPLELRGYITMTACEGRTTSGYSSHHTA